MVVLSLGQLLSDATQVAVPVLSPFLVREQDISFAAVGTLVFASMVASSVVQTLPVCRGGVGRCSCRHGGRGARGPGALGRGLVGYVVEPPTITLLGMTLARSAGLEPATF